MSSLIIMFGLLFLFGFTYFSTPEKTEKREDNADRLFFGGPR